MNEKSIEEPTFCISLGNAALLNYFGKLLTLAKAIPRQFESRFFLPNPDWFRRRQQCDTHVFKRAHCGGMPRRYRQSPSDTGKTVLLWV